MKLKLNMVVAALALVSAGTSNAAMSLMASGDSSLIFVGYDRTGAAVGSYVADLGSTLSSFLPTSSINAPGTTIQWNFSNNSVSVNGGAGSTTGNGWSTNYSSFLGAIQTPELRWAIVAGDSVNGVYLTTGTPTANNVSNANVAGRLTSDAASNMGFMDDVLSSNNNAGNHSTTTNGSSFATAGTPFNLVIARFGTAGNWNNSLTWNATSADNASTRFQLVDLFSPFREGTDGEPLPVITQFGNPNGNAPSLASVAGSFSFNSSSGTLTWAAAPVPEPSGYALALAGLGMLGFMARRRKV